MTTDTTTGRRSHPERCLTTTASTRWLPAPACRCSTGPRTRRSGRQVAIKVPHREMEADPVLFERFKREEEIGQLLDHPGIVKTFNSEARSRVYMVIEWVDGRLLRAVAERREEAAGGASGKDRAGDVPRAGLHAQAGDCASRPEAGKRDGGCARRDQADRLRHRDEGRRAPADVCEPLCNDGHARLHFTRAGEGPARRPAQRHLRDGHHALRDADGAGAVCGSESAGGDERAAAERSASAARV